METSPENEDAKLSHNEVLNMTAEIVAAYVSFNKVTSDEVPTIIRSVFDTLASRQTPAVEAQPKQKPAVPIKRSVTPDYIVCLEDGRKLKMLKRHLRSAYDMSPEEYRAKWNLPPDYPMVAPNYAEQRSRFAKQIGLGRKRKS